jgi:DNA-binding NarL/FixJ family response regulator
LAGEPPPPPRRVAFCDDAEGFGALLTFWFEDMDVDLVGSARSFDELEALLQSADVDVLLLDLVLPGMRMSTESVARARALATGAQVFLMSSLPGDVLAERARELGADGSWSKSAGADALRALLTP